MKRITLCFSITTTVLFVISRLNSVNSENNNSKCNGSCVTGNTRRFLPFPFGFSSGCPIRLNCSSTGVEIGDFHVLNVTPTNIIVDLPAKCNRRLDSIAVLFGENYSVRAANNFLLQNCSKAVPTPCDISPTFLERSFKLKPCVAKRSDISCLSGGYGAGLMNYKDVNNTQCHFLLSSTAILTEPERGSSVSLVMGRINLKWWVKGKCNCDENANCTEVKNGNKTVGFTCLCREGFEGDGFKQGGGCRRGESSPFHTENYVFLLFMGVTFRRGKWVN